MDDIWYMKKADAYSIINKIHRYDVCIHKNNGIIWEYSACWTANSHAVEPNRYVTYHPDYFSYHHSKCYIDFTNLEGLNMIIETRQVQPGDIIYFYDDDNCTHVSFINDVTDNDILIASHTSPAFNKSFSLNYNSSYRGAYTKFRIVCINDIIVS